MSESANPIPVFGNSEAAKCVENYCRSILGGQVPAGRQVKLCILRHVRDLVCAESRGYVFSTPHAEFAIAFIEACCRHSKNSPSGEIKAGDPFVLSDWQRFIVWCLFGWRRADDRGRRFQRVLIELARKNGKSTFMSAVMLLLLVADQPTEEASEIYCVATKEAQAKIVFREAVNMVSQSKTLKKRLRVFAKSIFYRERNGFIQILGSDSKSTDGLNTSAVIGDELHEWQKKHEGLFEKITTAGGARFQPLVIFITTAGHDGSDLWIAEHDYFSRINESSVTSEVVDDTVFGFLASIDYHSRPCPGCSECGRERANAWVAMLPDKCDGSGEIKGDDPFDESCWIKANPNYKISIAERYMRAQANEAKQKPTALNTFLRYHMNVRVSSSAQFITTELWQRGSGPIEVPKGAIGFGGFDLARSNDFAAFAAVFPVGDDIHIIGQSFTCEGRSDQLNNAQIWRWIESGELIEYKGDAIDYPDVLRRMVEFSKHYTLRTWAYDPQFGRVIGQSMQEEHGLTVFEFTQSARYYNEPIRRFEDALKAGRVRHGGKSCLAWQASNVTLSRDARDLWMPDKSRPQAKIDQMVSTFMAYSEMLFHEKELSVYDERDLRVLGVD